jgi:hypothetical protein
VDYFLHIGGCDEKDICITYSATNTCVPSDPVHGERRNAYRADAILLHNQGNEIAMTFAGDASGAQYDIVTVGFTTLTNWKSNVTAGNFWSIFVCRDGDADASTVGSYSMSLTIRYGSTQIGP